VLHAITFDFWFTLYQDASAEEARLRLLEQFLACQGEARSWKALQAAYAHGRTVLDHYWRKEHRSASTEHWLHEILTFLKADLSNEVVSSLCRPLEEVYLGSDQPQLISGVSTVLPHLAQRYRLGLISDTGLTPGRVLREILRRDNLLSCFNFLAFSDEIGVTKPVPEIFQRTLAALGARPEEAAHIGDLPETDYTGARSVGMRAVLFLGVSQRHDGLPLADAAFEDYSELVPLLTGLGASPGAQPSWGAATSKPR
jgi:putative hydrolase of the HAD superfamily